MSALDRSLGGCAMVHTGGMNHLDKYELDTTVEDLSVAHQNGARAAYEPVSYTHLDVYKRQAHDHPNNSPPFS